MWSPIAVAGFLALPVALSLCADCLAEDSKAHVRVALAQIEIRDGELSVNMRRAEEAIRQAAKQDVDMVCLPEAADFGWLYRHSRRDAFPIPGRYTDFLSKLAKELNVWICAGCLEKFGDRTYNSAVLIDRHGRIVLKHRKINTLPELTSHLYDAGKIEDIRTADTEFGRIGLTICADNFSPANPKRAAELGAWLLIAPHGFAAEAGDYENNAASFRKHICRVAKESGLWVVGTDAVMGRVADGAWEGRLHTGCSTIADPDGDEKAVGSFLRPDLVVYDIRHENG